MFRTIRRVPKRRAADLQTRRRLAVAGSVALASVGTALVVVGIIAWSSPRQPAVLLTRGVSIPIQASPWFDPGTTVFAAQLPDGKAVPPDQIGCVLRTAAGSRRLTEAPDAELGSRVRKEASLVAAVVVGPTASGDRISCNGPYPEAAEVWLMPTLPSMSLTPMSVVVTGVGCLGVAMLINPRAAGSRRS